MATINMHMKFEIEIPKQTWLMLRKPCRLQTDGRTRWIQGESSIPPLQHRINIYYLIPAKDKEVIDREKDIGSMSTKL